MAAHARICSPNDLLALTALPEMAPASPSATLLRLHTLLLCAWADHAALGVAQRIFKARIVTHEMSVISQLTAANFRWYEWAHRFAAEAEAVELQRAVAVFNGAFVAWASNVFLARAELWQPDNDERRQREARNAAVIADSAAVLDRAAAALSAAISADADEVAALAAHWARLRDVVPLRADGIGSADGRPMRAFNAAQARAVAAAVELGEKFDATDAQNELNADA